MSRLDAVWNFSSLLKGVTFNSNLSHAKEQGVSIQTVVVFRNGCKVMAKSIFGDPKFFSYFTKIERISGIIV